MAPGDRRRVYLADRSSLDRLLSDPVWSTAEVPVVIEWLLKKIVANLRSRTIRGPNGDPYLTRWYVWPGKPRSTDNEAPRNVPFAVFIHFFHRSDKDRDQHNHPWDRSIALILKGGYVEKRGSAYRTFLPGDVNIIRKDDYHSVTLIDEKRGSWSLFIAGKNIGSWGFRDSQTGKHIPWRDYF